MAKSRVTRTQIDEFLWANCYKRKVAIPRDKDEFLTTNGQHYLSIEIVKMLVEIGVSEQLGTTFKGKNKPVNYGFNPTSQAWIGFSHRGYHDFKVGDKVEKEDFVCCKKGFQANHVFTSLEECKKAAMLLADHLA